MRIIGNLGNTARKVQAVASGALASGDTVIVNANGTVSVVAATGSEITSDAVWTTNNAKAPSVAFDAANGLVVIAYNDADNNEYGVAIVATISGTTLTFGSATVFNSGHSVNPSISFDVAASKFVIAYRDIPNSQYGNAIVATVNASNRSITFGSEASYSTAAATTKTQVIYDPDAEKHFFVYERSQKIYARVGTVSGTSISWGTEVVATGGVYSDKWTDGTALITGTSKFFTAFMGNGTGVMVCISTVSGTSLSWGSVQTINSNANAGYAVPVYDSTLSKMVTFFRTHTNGTGIGHAVISTISGTTVSSGSAITWESSEINRIHTATFDPVNNKIVVIYQLLANSSSTHYYRIISISGSGLVISDRAEIATGSEYIGFGSAYDSNNVQIINAFNDATTNGTTRIIKSAGTTLTSENYIGIASNGYASGQAATINSKGFIDDNQSSLTAGQSYFVQSNGDLGLTAGTPSVFAGTAVSATKLIVKG